MRKRTQENAHWNVPAPETGTSLLASRPFAVQTKADTAAISGQSENHTFVQHKLESLGLQLKANQGTITPTEQAQLGVLQAKMNDFWVQRSQQSAQLNYNAAHIPIHRPDTPAPTPVQPKLILRSPQSSASSTPQSLQRKLRTAIPTSPIQAKLTIGAPGDKYEQEANQVAQQVVQRLHSPAQDNSQAQPTLQRKSHPEEEELQTRLQRKPQLTEVDSGEADSDLESSIQRARSSGQPLAPKLQRQMGQAIGADFSGVKVHTDANASQLNQSIQAKAFTTGQDIFFKGGEYKPESRSGQELIAHELTHVVQQKGDSSQTPQVNAAPRSIQRLISAADFQKKTKLFARKGKSHKTFSALVEALTTYETADDPEVKFHTLNQALEIAQDWLDSEKSADSSRKKYVQALIPELKAAIETNAKDLATQAPQNQNEESYDSFFKKSNKDQYLATQAPQNQNEESYDSFSFVTKSNKDKDLASSLSNSREIADLDPDFIPKDNKDVQKYFLLKEISSHYAGEDSDSSDFVFEKVFRTTKEGFLNSPEDEIRKDLQGIGWKEAEIESLLKTGKTQVKYLKTEESRADYELKGGSTLVQGEPPTPFDTTEMYANGFGKGHGIYVMSPGGKLYGEAHKIGLFHHSSFLAGLPTAAAGTLNVTQGKLKEISCKTGHYQAGKEQLYQVLMELKERGINLSGVDALDHLGRKFSGDEGDAAKFLEVNKTTIGQDIEEAARDARSQPESEESSEVASSIDNSQIQADILKYSNGDPKAALIDAGLVYDKGTWLFDDGQYAPDDPYTQLRLIKKEITVDQLRQE